MFSNFFKLAAVAFCLCLLNACSSSGSPASGTASFTLVSDQTSKISRYYVPVSGPVEERDCIGFYFFYLILSGNFPVEETLLAKILEKHNADVLLDVEIKRSISVLPLILDRSCLTISGTPAKLRSAP
ncbi:MAG: hypothetical protein LBU89_13490 [Fibromonadaceae bacterium]|jgi:hypothetical protein|nr:hypothetical protein [Fibromonadaceae bacterium]